MKTIEELFSFNLRRLRGDASQAAIAEKAGIPTVSYARAENGYIPRAKARKKIAKAFGLESEIELFQDPSPREITPAEALEVLRRALAAQKE